MICILTKCYSDNPIKNVMGGARGTFGGYERCIRGSGRET
jgi:hypothetical protein